MYNGRVALNLQRFTESLNDSDFRFAYNKLAPGFRNNNFPTLQSFETYMRNTIPERFTVEHGAFRQEGDVYLQTIRFVDRNPRSEEVVEKTFIMQLGEGTDFVLSFNII